MHRGCILFLFCAFVVLLQVYCEEAQLTYSPATLLDCVALALRELFLDIGHVLATLQVQICRLLDALMRVVHELIRDMSWWLMKVGRATGKLLDACIRILYSWVHLFLIWSGQSPKDAVFIAMSTVVATTAVIVWWKNPSPRDMYLLKGAAHEQAVERVARQVLVGLWLTYTVFVSGAFLFGDRFA